MASAQKNIFIGVLFNNLLMPGIISSAVVTLQFTVGLLYIEGIGSYIGTLF